MFDFTKNRLEKILNNMYNVDIVMSECTELLVIRISKKTNNNICVCLNYVISDKQLNFAIVSSNLNINEFIELSCLSNSISKNMLAITNLLKDIKEV